MNSNINAQQKRLITRLFLFMMPPLTLMAIFLGPYLIGDNHFKITNLFPISQEQQVSNNNIQSSIFVLTNCLFLFSLIAFWVSAIYVVSKFQEVFAFWLKSAIYQAWALIIINLILIINYAFFSYSNFNDIKISYVNYTHINILALILFIISIIALVVFNKWIKAEVINEENHHE